MKKTLQLPLIALGAVLVVAFAVFAYSQHASASKTIHIRWLVAHQPSAVFQKAEKLLASELLKESSNTYSVEFLTPEDMGLTTPVAPDALVGLLRDGKVDLVSMNIDSVIAYAEAQQPSATRDIEVVQLPYLFKTYASTDKVLDGNVGKELLASIDSVVPAHALAFTYSGGFRVIASAKGPLSNPTDLKGQRINTWGSPLMQKSIAGLGATAVPVAMIGGGKDLIESGSSDGVELTYTRADEALGSNVKYVLETNHVLFLSALFASEQFYGSLSPEAKQILDAASLAAAQTERADSIAFNAQVRQDLIDSGVSVVSLTPAQRSALESWAVTFRDSLALPDSVKKLEQEIIDAQK